jgi:hypothetical protein
MYMSKSMHAIIVVMCIYIYILYIPVYIYIYMHEPMHAIMYIANLYACSNIYVETFACYNRCTVYTHTLMYMSEPMHVILAVMFIFA